jgi:Tfp pilus assembly protein PilN
MSSGPQETRSHLPGKLDLNILPERYRQPRLRWASVAPWLSLLGMAALVYYTFNWFSASNQTYETVVRRLAHQQGTLAALEAPSGTQAALAGSVATLQAQTQNLRAASSSLNLQQVAWGEQLQFALSLAPSSATIDRIEQNGRQIVLTGSADDYSVALDYARKLEAAGGYAAVEVELISVLPQASPTPAATPSRSRTAKTPTPVPTAAPIFNFRITLTNGISNEVATAGEGTHAP